MLDPVVVLAALGGSDCERVGGGWLAQPVNAVSSLAYVAVGTWLLHRAGTAGADRPLLTGAGAAMAVIGLGSVAYHGPQPAWADVAHNAAIAGLPLVVAGHAARRFVKRRPRLTGISPAAVARRWWPALAWGVVALVAYDAGRTTSPRCRPDSLWQFHAAWHGLSAVALGAGVLALGEPSRAPSPG